MASFRNLRTAQLQSRPLTTFSSVSSRPTNRSFLTLVASNRVSAVHRILRDPRCSRILDLNARVGLDGGKTPLTSAASAGHTRIVSLLLALAPKRLDVNAVDGFGNTPLHCAAANGHLEVVQLLVAAPGVDCGVRNKNGQTAVTLAMERLAREGGVGYGSNETKTGVNIRQCLKRLWACEKKAGSTATMAVHKHAPITPPEPSVHARLGAEVTSKRWRQELHVPVKAPKAEIWMSKGNRPSIPMFKSDLRDRLQERGSKQTLTSTSALIKRNDAKPYSLQKISSYLKDAGTNVFSDEDVKSIEVFEVEDSGSDGDEDVNVKRGRNIHYDEDCIITRCTMQPQIKTLWHGK